MPIWLRLFTYKKLLEHYEKRNPQQDNIEQSIKNMKSVGATKKQTPTYTTKASKK